MGKLKIALSNAPDKISKNTFWKWFSIISIIIGFIGVVITIISLFIPNNLSYEEQKEILEKAGTEFALNQKLTSETGYNISEIQKIALEFKDKAKNSYDKGLAYFNLKEFNSAIYFFNESLNSGFTSKDHYFYIGSAYLNLKDYSLSRYWLSFCEEDFQCLGQIAASYYIQGNFDLAIKYEEKSLEILPNPLGYYNMGTAYIRQKGVEGCEEAIIFFDKSLEFSDQAYNIISSSSSTISGGSFNRDNVKFNKATCLMNLGQYNKSLSLFKEIELNNRSDESINTNLALNYFYLKDCQNAILYSFNALNQNPKESITQDILFSCIK